MDPDAVCWVLSYTKFAVEVAAFVLYDNNDHLCLWSLSRDVAPHPFITSPDDFLKLVV